MPDASTDSLTSRHSSLIAAAISLVVGGVIIAVLVLVVPRIVSYGEVWRAFRGLSWVGIAAVSFAAILNLLTYGPSLMAALPGIGYRAALTASLASQASTYVAPGGPAVGLGIAFLMLRAWRFARRRVTLALGLVTLWNQLTTLALPVVAFVILWLSGERNPLLQTVALIGLLLALLLAAVVASSLRSARFARRAADATASVVSAGLRLIRRPPVSGWGDEVTRFRADALGLLRARWHWLTLWTLAGHLTVYLVLIVTLRAVGVGADEVSLAESFAAWSVVRVLGAIPILPSGVGVVEVGLTTALLGSGGDEAGVLASVLIYRFLTVVVPLVCGGIAGAMWRRQHPGVIEEASAGA